MDDLAARLVVVDDEHALAAQVGGSGVRQGGRRRPAQPHGEPEGAALARRALHADLPAHQLDELLADGQPQPRAAVLAGGRAVGLAERVEELRLLLRRHALSGAWAAKRSTT